jgi:hypothetical protein
LIHLSVCTISLVKNLSENFSPETVIIKTVTHVVSLDQLTYPIGSCEESGFRGIGRGALEAVGTHDQVPVAAPRQAGVEALALLQVPLLVVPAAPAAAHEAAGVGAPAPQEHPLPELQGKQNGRV